VSDNRIRFHLDENVDSDIAKALRRQSVDVTTTAEIGLIGQPDKAQLAFVYQSGRVLVTHDADFLRFSNQRLNHCGITFCKKNVRTLGEIIRSLMLIYEVFTPEEMHGQVEYL
jgi:predicted nuclease of predicted toxin-antitoxin system